MQDHTNPIPDDEELRRLLREGSGGPAGWDQPGERVWLGIAADLSRRPRRRGAWWPWIAGALLLALATGWGLLREPGNAPGYPGNTSLAKIATPPGQGASASSAARTSGPTDPRSAAEKTPGPGNASPATGARASSPVGHPTLPSRSQAAGTARPDPALPASAADTLLRAVLPNAAPLPVTADPAPPENRAEMPGAPSRDGQGDPALAHLPLRQHRLEAPATLLPAIARTLPMPPQSPRSNVHHEIGISAHGNGVNTSLRARQGAFRPADVLSQEQTAYRWGLHYHLVTPGGWVFGTGLDHQRIRENSRREHEIPFTRQGSMPDPQGLAQTFSLSMYGAMGQIRASVPVRILERMAPLDYQEGETIRLNVDWSQQLDLLRIPLWAGWRQEWRGWFLEGRGGMALSMPLRYRGDIRQVREFRNRVRIREGSTTEKPDGLRDIIPEWQACLHIGRHLPQGWHVRFGWEYWRSWQSVIRHPDYRSTLQGQGITFGISKRI